MARAQTLGPIVISIFRQLTDVRIFNYFLSLSSSQALLPLGLGLAMEKGDP